MNTIDQNPDIEHVLRNELAARAGDLNATPAPYAAVRRAVRRDRGRRLVGAASGLALLAALAVVLTQTLGSAPGKTIGSAAGIPSSLLTIPTRGNLADDSDFLTAVKQRLDTPATHTPQSGAGRNVAGPTSTARTYSYPILYANDDGTHRVVVAAMYNESAMVFTVLVGAHDAAAPALKNSDSVGFGTLTSNETFTFMGDFTTNGDPVPFVVLGPPSMTNVEYATGATLTSTGGKLTLVRSHITQADTVNGAAAGEIPGAHTLADAAWLDDYTVFRAQLGAQNVEAGLMTRSSPALLGNLPTDPAYTAIKAAVALKGQATGLTMHTDSAGGDAVPDNAAVTLLDLAQFDRVPLSSLTYQVDWIGRETAQWDAALLDVHAPGLPPMQIFVRGLTAEAPDSASPGLMNTLVRPAAPLTPGHVPHTGASFGGTPEPTLFGFQTMTTW